MNRVFLLGNIGQAPEVKTFEGGGKVASFTLATSKSWKDKDGNKQERVCWHNIEASGVKADVVAGYLAKGSKILVEGEIDNQVYEKDGVKRTYSKVRLINFEFCDKKPETDRSYTGGGSRMDPSITSTQPDQNSKDMNIPF